MLQRMSSSVVYLLSIAGALQGLSVSVQILMQRKNVGYLLRSPFGTMLNIVAHWALRKGSRDPVLNRLRQKRWLAREVSRTVVCEYFDYPTVLKLSTKDIGMVILYGLTLPVSKLAGGIIEWLVLVAIIIVAYYSIVIIWILFDLASRQTIRLRLSYLFGTIFKGRVYYSSYVIDLISLDIASKEMIALAVNSESLGWWAKRYWNIETHEEKMVIREIIQGILEYSRSEVDVQRKKPRRNRSIGFKTFVRAREHRRSVTLCRDS